MSDTDEVLVAVFAVEIVILAWLAADVLLRATDLSLPAFMVTTWDVIVHAVDVALTASATAVARVIRAVRR